jgi:hypothetical protein
LFWNEDDETMRFHLSSGLVPSRLDFSPEEHGWHRLTRPSGISAMLLSVVIAFALFLGVSLAFYYFASVRLQEPSSIFLLALFIPLLPAHELFHCLVHPGLGMTSRTCVGFYPRRLAFYAHYSGERTRARFLTGALTPLIMLSVLPLILCASFRLQLPTLAWVSTLNATLSATDVMTALVLWFRCPSGSVVLTDQDKAWWRISTIVS